MKGKKQKETICFLCFLEGSQLPEGDFKMFLEGWLPEGDYLCFCFDGNCPKDADFLQEGKTRPECLTQEMVGFSSGKRHAGIDITKKSDTLLSTFI